MAQDNGELIGNAIKLSNDIAKITGERPVDVINNTLDPLIKTGQAGPYKHNPINMGDWGKQPSGWCFITTAVCGTLGKPDNCEELRKFRYFRDTFMSGTPEMKAEVEEYYKIAPEICAAIDMTGAEAASKKYAAIWEESLEPAFMALNMGDNDKAHDIYKNMVMGLKEQYLEGGI
jgi:hypothetical protein